LEVRLQHEDRSRQPPRHGQDGQQQTRNDALAAPVQSDARVSYYRLRALFWREYKSPNDQKYDRADDGSDQPCPFASLIPTDGLAEVGRNERPDNAENGRQDKPCGSLGPGWRNLAMIPAMKPIMMVQRMCHMGAVLSCVCRFWRINFRQKRLSSQATGR